MRESLHEQIKYRSIRTTFPYRNIPLVFFSVFHQMNSHPTLRTSSSANHQENGRNNNENDVFIRHILTGRTQKRNRHVAPNDDYKQKGEKGEDKKDGIDKFIH